MNSSRPLTIRHLTTQLPTTQHLTTQSPRTAVFRDASRERGAADTSSPRKRHQAEGFFERYSDLPYPARYARSLAYALENEPVYLLPDEHLVGMLYQIPSRWEMPKEEHARQWESFDPGKQMRERQREIIDPFVGGGGAPGHIGWNWDQLLTIGVEAHMADLAARRDAATDENAIQLYEGAIILWQSVLNWNDRHLAALRSAARTARRQDENSELQRLEQLIDICERVPHKPPRSFHEAVQFFNFQHLAVLFENPFGGNGPGRADQILWP